MPSIERNGKRLYYEIAGTGEALLLISGLGCDHTIWSLVSPALSQRYRVVSFDNLGSGESSNLDHPCTIADMAKDAALILEELSIGRAHVAGHSMGGMIAQELALAYPDRVQSLLLLSSCAECDSRGKAIIETLGDLPRLVDPPTCARLFMPWLYTEGFYSKPGSIVQLMKWLLECPHPPTAEGMYHQSRAISAFNSLSRLGQITCPTDVIVGSEDILLPINSSRQLAQGIANAEIAVLEKTGHGLLIETPEVVASAMLNFLELADRKSKS